MQQAPSCKCNPPQEAVQKEAGETSKNPGKLFWTCPTGKKEYGGCGFFMFDDQLQKGRPATKYTKAPTKQTSAPSKAAPYPAPQKKESDVEAFALKAFQAYIKTMESIQEQQNIQLHTLNNSVDALLQHMERIASKIAPEEHPEEQ